MNVRGLLFGSTLRIAVALLLGLGVVVGGGFAAGVFGVPGVVAVDNAFGPVNESTTTIESELVVNNPNPVGASFDDAQIDYRIRMNDIPMAHGGREGLELGTGNTTIPLETYLMNDQIPKWWASHLQNGERSTMTIDATLYSGTLNRSRTFTHEPEPIETDIESQFDTNETRPINAGLPFVSDPVLYLNSTSGTWGDVTEKETPIEMTFTLYNPKDYPISMTRLGYDITMNDVAVGEGTTSKSVTIPAHSAKQVEATTIIDNSKLDEWWVTHLQRDQVTDMRIHFYARFDVGGDSIRIPLRNVTYTIETDMFDNKAQNSGSSGDGSTEDENETATTTDDGSANSATTTTTTTTQTTTTTTTSTTTTTEEDDGILS